MRKNVEKLTKNDTDILKKIRALKLLQADFTVAHSNYTTSIEYANKIERYLTNLMHEDVFVSYQKLKKTIDYAAISEFDYEGAVTFFDIADVLPYDIRVDNIVNIDLNSAYAMALFNHEIINNKGFQILTALPKKRRLQTVGMFAASKTVYEYARGELIGVPDIITNDLKNVFWFAAHTIDQIMSDLKFMSKDLFIYYWFDGIYLKYNKYVVGVLCEFLDSIGMPYKTTMLTEFKIVENDLVYNITFKENGEPKIFNIPDKAKIRRSNALIHAALLNVKKK